MEFATGTAGILSSWELNRLAAAVTGTYKIDSTEGAVTFNASYTFNVAAIAAGSMTINGTPYGSIITATTTVLATADATNPRIDTIWANSSGTVGNTTGTPKALTSTAGPVPTAPGATEYVLARVFVPANNTPAMGASSITNLRQASSSGGLSVGQLWAQE